MVSKAELKKLKHSRKADENKKLKCRLRITSRTVSAGDYILQVSFIGYDKTFRRANVSAQSDLGDINLVESATQTVNSPQNVIRS